MGTVTGFTAERMLQIENSTVVDGEVQGDNLILLTRDGTPIDAGSVRGPIGPVGPASMFPGVISMYGGNTPPAGYLLCQGQTVLRATYPELFAVLGTIYGAGDGSTTFALPDLQQRFPVGKGTQTWADVLGEAGGSKDASLPQHQHDMGHSHTTSNHQHGFDHGHTASSDIDNAYHGHYMAPHSHGESGNNDGSGYVSRQVVAGGTGAGYDIVNSNPERTVSLFWRDNPPTSVSYIGVDPANAQHNHIVRVATLTGTATTQAGAQTLTHAGNTLPQGVVATDKNLPPYVVVNFIIKT